MNAASIIARMEHVPQAVLALLSGVSVAESHFKPPSGAWSIVEIVCHLVDEDRDDFRKRLRLTLESPGTPWPLNDPEAWARDRKY